MKLLQLSPQDSVSIVVEADEGSQAIPQGHKVANSPIKAGESVFKYGQVIGLATKDIAAGDHVHAHNCSYSKVTDRQLVQKKETKFETSEKLGFQGFQRANGKVGTRNFVGLISTVSCSATVAEKAAAEANSTLLSKFENIDGFVPITHGTGCGMSGEGSPSYELLKRTMSGYIEHPNFGATLQIGLGCEVNQLKGYSDLTSESMEQIAIQDAGGTRSAIDVAVQKLGRLAEIANQSERSNCPISEISLGLQCGGSDAFSSLTCNPALGVASDILVASGGTSFLAETPEIFGAEHLLFSRMEQEEADQLRTLLDWWQNYAELNGTNLDNNPSPGNKAGGLTTILEKSLGAVAKSGQSSFSSVVRYAERPPAKGLTFMDSPGYDPVSVTGQIAAGANIVAFTTGRGSCFGSKPVPTIKLASNSSLYKKMTEDMDIDCGRIVEEKVAIESMGKDILDYVLAVASGKKSKSEINGLGDLEFEPWRTGAVL